jgi:amino acid permease
VYQCNLPAPPTMATNAPLLVNHPNEEMATDVDRYEEMTNALWSPPNDVRTNLVSPGGTTVRSSSSKRHEKQGTISSSVFNLCNTVLGSGTLAMGYACKRLGVIGFVLAMVFLALLADYAIEVLFLSVKKWKVQRARYPSMGRKTMGSFGENVSSWVVTVQQFGACIGYTVIIGDVLQPIAALSGLEWTCERWPLQLGLLSCVIFPLLLLPSMDSLKYVSFISLVLIWSAVIAIAVNGFLVVADPYRREELMHPRIHTSTSVCNVSSSDARHYNHSTITTPSSSSSSSSSYSIGHMNMFPNSFGDALAALPIISFAFLCHQNTFPIYNELKNASPKRMATVGHYSITICCLVYILSGIMGYYTFLSDTQSDLLRNFKVENTYFSLPMDIVRTGFGISCVLSFPLMVWEARHNLDVLLFGNRPYQFWRNFGLNFLILSLCGSIGMSVKNLDVVLGFIGSTCSPIMIFCLPALFYLVPQKKRLTCKNFRSIFLFLWGLLLIPCCLTMWSMENFVCIKDNENGSALPSICNVFGIH